MRVTESRMLELATEAAAQARQRASDAAGPAAGGLRVNRPSDDLAAWQEGERASISAQESTQRGSALERVQDKLQASDGALSTISTSLSRAQELAVEMANDGLTASQRSAAGTEVSSIYQTVLAAANTAALGGDHLFAGSQTNLTPFSAVGAYGGDSLISSVELSQGQQIGVGVTGNALTAAGGVDVLATLSSLVTALNTNNAAGIQTALTDLTTAVAQVAGARSQLGSQMSALSDADDARKSLEVQLASVHQRAVESDPIEAASALAQAKNALDSASTVAGVVQQIASGK